MDYKLVGSRAMGTNGENSDYDFMLNGVVGTCKEVDVWGRMAPSWTTASMSIDVSTVKEEIRRAEKLPASADIDLFGFITVEGREGDDHSVGLCNLKQNFCLTIGASMEEAEAKLIRNLDWEY